MIGIFDSGIGGLTVAAAIRQLLPAERLLYLGDTARVPYGTKSPTVIRRYALECTMYLLEQGVKAVVVACNTVSAVALPRLREMLSVPLIGVIEPGVEAGLKTTVKGRIGILGTPSTIASQAYQSRLKALRPDVVLRSIACPLFVPLAEEGLGDSELARQAARYYLSPLKRNKIDTLILGCTHYPLLKSAIQSAVGDDVRLVDSAGTTAGVVREILLREGLLRTHGNGGIECLFTDLAPRSEARLNRFFGGQVEKIRKVTLE
ncbi:MAG: glutamate racemase [Calditrichaeota bacterium]|nr:glutamate racemase [Calditrichota bacterium]